MSDLFAMTNSLLEAAGIDPDTVTEVTYHHAVGGLPTITAEVAVIRPGTLRPITYRTHRWQLVRDGRWRRWARRLTRFVRSW